MNTSNRPSRMPSAPVSGPDEQLWHAAVSEWENPKLHELLLGHCHSPAQLAALAGKYRTLLDDAARKAVAEAQLKRIAEAAMARMDVLPTPRRIEPAGGLGWKVALICLFVLGSVVLFRFL
jgi:hypothetical protein